MAELLTTEDLLVFDQTLEADKAAKLIEFVTAEARRVAPCLKTATDPDTLTSAKGILLRAALRWAEQGNGALQQWTNVDGPFTRSASIDNRAGTSHSIFYPSERDDLKSLCPRSSGSQRVTTRWAL